MSASGCPLHWPRLAAIGVVVGIGMCQLEFFTMLLLPSAARLLAGPGRTSTTWLGNATLLAIYLAANLRSPAFGEEMVWRGLCVAAGGGFPQAAAYGRGSGRSSSSTSSSALRISTRGRRAYPGDRRRRVLGILYIATGRNLLRADHRARPRQPLIDFIS